MQPISINGQKCGDGYPCYVIAEIGGAFRNFEEAKRLIDSAINAGADAVKFQTLEADTITTKNISFDMEATGNISQYDLFKQFELPKSLQLKVVEYANECGITIFSAPSHIQDLEIMKKMNLPVYKIGSDLACHIPLLKKIAEFNKPIIMSTGMCTLSEVQESVETILGTGNEQLALLHCVSNYPAKMEEANLTAILQMKKEFNLPVGYSDHTQGIIASQAAVSMGANIIERHLHDSRNRSSPDDIHALTESEFTDMINSIRSIESAQGNGKKQPSVSELKNLKTNRVSIIALQEIKLGSVISPESIDIRRPGTGLAPKFFEEILGRKARVDIHKDEPITWDKLL